MTPSMNMPLGEQFISMRLTVAIVAVDFQHASTDMAAPGSGCYPRAKRLILRASTRLRKSHSRDLGDSQDYPLPVAPRWGTGFGVEFDPCQPHGRFCCDDRL